MLISDKPSFKKKGKGTNVLTDWSKSQLTC